MEPLAIDPREDIEIRHPGQEVRFEVVRGRLSFRVGDRSLALGEGERLTVPAGVAHAYWNAGAEPAIYVAEIRTTEGGTP